MQSVDLNGLKRRVRDLKRLEVKIRGTIQPGASLVWDSLFDLRTVPGGKAKYTLATLSGMSREAYREVVDEFFALVYFAYYRENGIISCKNYSPSVLAQLDLPFDASEQDVKKRFRELAKKYHPDTGGDATKFIALMKVYEQLTGR